MKKIVLLLLLIAIPKINAQNITAMEYFIDQDPGMNNATNIAGFSSSSNVANYNFTIPNNLANGIHAIGYRTKDANNVWSHTNFKPFYVSSNQALFNITEIEYFWDTDNGFGGNTIHSVLGASTNLSNYAFQAAVPNFTIGSTHKLFVRTKDANGKFSHTNYLTQIEIIQDLSVSETEKSEIALFPNPVVDYLNVRTVNNEPFRLLLYDSLGKQLLDTVITEDQQIDMSQMESGLYLAYIWNPDSNKIRIVKIIKN